MSSSFPLSSSHLGDVIRVNENNRAMKDEPIDTPVHSESFVTSDRIDNDSIKDQFHVDIDLARNESYIIYTEQKNERDLHDSYRYLLSIVSSRVELSPLKLHVFVQQLEHRLFCSNISEEIGKLIF